MDGAHCAACISAIEGSLATHPAILHVRLNLSLRRLSVAWRGAPGLANEIAGKVESLGYTVAPYDSEHLSRSEAETGRELLRALAVAAFASSNVMMLSLAVWAGQSQDMAPATQALLQWVSALITLPAIAIAGKPFFRQALKAVRHGRTNIDVPISLGVILTTAISLLALANGGAEVYFDSAASLLFVLLIGRYLDFRTRSRSRAAVERLLMLKAYGAAVCRDDGGVELLPASAVEIGMIILVRPGERVPVDGVVIDGRSSIDASIVTGENAPVLAYPGAALLAGSVNGAGVLRLSASQTIDRSHLAEIVKLVEEAELRRSAPVQFADRVAAAWTPALHGLALATFIGWWLVVGAEAETALLHAVSVLIIACPCAIGLAIPAAQVVATGSLLKRGVLLRSGDALDRLAEIDLVAFDKTGTLSDGAPSLIERPDDEDAIRLAASIAAASHHPLARSIAAALPDMAVAQGVIEHEGFGLSIASSAGEIRLGSAAFCSVLADAQDEASEVWLSRPNLPPARFGFRDVARPGAKETVRRLKARGIEVVLLSGDRQTAVEGFARGVGIERATGALKPSEKLAILDAWRSAGRRALMVGDGLNDAPALAGAHASASFAHGMPASQSAADIILPANQITALETALAAALRTRSVIGWNLGLAVAYNLVLAPVAMMGWVTPLGAAIAMSASSLTVTLNALRAGVPKRAETR